MFLATYKVDAHPPAAPEPVGAGSAVAEDGMNVRHHRRYPVESGFVPGPPGADYGVADPQVEQQDH